MTGLMTPDTTSVHASDTIAIAQRRLFKACAKHPRRTAFAILFGIVKALALVAWLVSRQSTRTPNVAPRDVLQSEVISHCTYARPPTIYYCRREQAGMKTQCIMQEQLRASTPPTGLQDAFWRRHYAESSAALEGKAAISFEAAGIKCMLSRCPGWTQ